MGILNDSVKKVQALKEKKKQLVIDRLVSLGVLQNQYGEPLGSLDYDELKYLLVLAEMKQVDIHHPEHKWFR